MAFRFAGSIAFKEAARKASPVLLEPVMAVEIEVPENSVPQFAVKSMDTVDASRVNES